MSRVSTEQITRERLEIWQKDFARDHATPVMLIGVRHDEHSGEISICTLEDPFMDDNAICNFLAQAIQLIREGKTHHNL